MLSCYALLLPAGVLLNPLMDCSVFEVGPLRENSWLLGSVGRKLNYLLKPQSWLDIKHLLDILEEDTENKKIKCTFLYLFLVFYWMIGKVRIILLKVYE